MSLFQSIAEARRDALIAKENLAGAKLVASQAMYDAIIAEMDWVEHSPTARIFGMDILVDRKLPADGLEIRLHNAGIRVYSVGHSRQQSN